MSRSRETSLSPHPINVNPAGSEIGNLLESSPPDVEISRCAASAEIDDLSQSMMLAGLLTEQQHCMK